MKKIIIIIIAAVLVIAGGITFGAIYNQPENVAIRSVSDIFEEAFTRGEASVFESVMKNGSIEFSLNEITHLADKDATYAEDVTVFGENDETISGKLYISPEALFLKNFKYYDGDIDISGEAYISDGLIYVKEDTLLDLNLGIELENLKRQFDDSIFAYDSGSEYSVKKLADMTEDEYEKLLDKLDIKDTEEFTSDLEKLISHVVERAWDIVKANAEFDSENESVMIGGHRKSARIITMTLDVDAMKLIVEEFATEVLKEDSKIAKFIKEHEDTLAKLDLYDTDEYASFAEYYAEAIDELRVNTVYKICDGLDSAEYEAIKIEIATPKLTSDLLKLTVDHVYKDESTGEYEDEEIFLIDFGGKGIKKSDDIRISFGDSDIRYIVSQNDRDAYSSRLYVNGEKAMSFFNNKVTDKFALVFYEDSYYGNDDMAMKYEILGSLAETDDGYDVKVTKYIETVSFDYEGKVESAETKLDLNIKVSFKDKMPDAPTDYKTIDEIEDAEVDAWKEKIGELQTDIYY